MKDDVKSHAQLAHGENGNYASEEEMQKLKKAHINVSSVELVGRCEIDVES